MATQPMETMLVRGVPPLCQQKKIFAKFSKFDFFNDKIQYLGHVVTKEGISVDPEKIKAIEDWQVTTGDSLKVFRGLRIR